MRLCEFYLAYYYFLSSVYSLFLRPFSVASIKALICSVLMFHVEQEEMT